jgi:hypothetical protein
LLSLSLDILLVVFLFLFPLAVSAHPGGLNASGCHTNRKTGEWRKPRWCAPMRACGTLHAGVSGPVKRKPTVSFKRVISLDLFQSQTVPLWGPNSRISICMADFWGS